MAIDADVIIIGAGAGGPVIAKELGEQGIKVLIVEAGPWYGNKKWPHPNEKRGATGSSSPKDLSHELLKESFSDLEDDMNNRVTGKFRWGPADRDREPWIRNSAGPGFVWQNSGVGGTTLQYYGNSPRAYPASVENTWPISYREMVPYYEKVEATLPVCLAPMTAKEELFFYGARKAGWSLLKTGNVTEPGYRPQPNAILPPPRAKDPSIGFKEESVGCTLRGHCVNGCSRGPTIEKLAKRSTLASYIPLALATGNVEVRPNTFVVKIMTENCTSEGLRAVGVCFRDTWTGECGELRSHVVVMAGGAIETPRLWLNSGLPDHPWVGKGLSTHWFDSITAVFDEPVLRGILGTTQTRPYVGHNSAARFDYPGLGMILALGISPGLYSSLFYGLSSDGYSCLCPPKPGEPWDVQGILVGEQLKEWMADYTRSLSAMIIIDDEINQNNCVTLDPVHRDEHGPIPLIHYRPGRADERKREQLACIAADIFRKAGARKVLRSNWPPSLVIHAESTMRMGHVTDLNCEACQVKRLFIADNSVLFNSLGGPNPTLTTQMLATRTAEKLARKYF